MNRNHLSNLSLSSIVISMLFIVCSCKNDKKTIENTTANSGVNPQLLALTEALEKNPNNDSLLFRRAEIFYEMEGYDAAIQDLAKAISIDSLQPNFYHLLADVFMDYTKSYQAVKTMEVAVSKFPDRTPTLLKMSEFYLIVKRHTEALQVLGKILERDPQNADAYYMTGRIALDMGDEKRAIAALKKATQLDATISDAWVFLGKIYANNKDPLAIQYYDNALRLDTSNIDIVLEKAVFYKRQGKFEKAFEIYRDLVKNNPNYSDAWFDMGMIYLEMDSVPKAYDHFNIAIKTEPTFVKAYYYRGVAAEEMGNLEGALADYKQAAKMSPNFSEAKEALERLKK